MLARLFILTAALVVAPATHVFAQSSSTPCQAITGTMELFKYGNQWLQWNELERHIYLLGFVDGGSVYFDFVFRQPERVRNELFEANAVKYDNDVLSPVITSLYRDPANVYIRYDSMVLIARDKIAGKDVEPRLRMARQNGCGGSLKK